MLYIDEEKLNNFRFADDIILITNNVEEITEIESTCAKVGLKINWGKTKYMTNQVPSEQLNIREQ